MGTLSALVVTRDRLPSTAELLEAISETGVTVVFPPEFRLDRSSAWVAIELDGDTTGFEYDVQAVTELDDEEAPASLRAHGDTLLSFEARGALSGEAVMLIQRVLAANWNAAGWIEDELVPPEEMAREDVPGPDMAPEMAAMLLGTPAERAAATQTYLDSFYPPVRTKAAPFAGLRPWLRGLIVPTAIFVVALAALAVWNALN